MKKKEKKIKAKSPDTAKKRKKAKEKLHHEEELFRAFVEHSSDIIVLLNLEGTIIYINPAVEQVLGFKPEERIGAKGFELVHPDDIKFLADSFNTLARDTNSPVIQGEPHLRHKDGSWRTLEAVGSNLVHNNVIEAVIINYRDITERKKTEEALRESEARHREREERYRNILDNMEEAYYEVDLKGNFTFFNATAVTNLGYTDNVMMGMNFRQYVDEENASKVFEAYNKVFLTGESIKGFDWELISKESGKILIESSISLMRDAQGNPIGFRGIIRDITERKRAIEALRQSEERYRALVENASDIIFRTNNTGHFTFVNPATLRITGYEEQVIIGMHYPALIHPDMRSEAIKFFGRQFVKGLHNAYSEYPIITKEGHEVWLGQNTQLIVENGNVTGFQSVARDITERKKAEETLKETLESLRKSIATTIQVLGTASEVRDPYTAGHQKRVADLARAIATEMGLPQDKIEGIRMAGSIHDIGKLSIPAEILSKPTKLTEIEFSMIKKHAQSGYEILKDVESPWPLAQIVYQHHERMNGSGYPRNLKGNEILIEARIMVVADVVETMASYRPYRPTLGIEAALEEIERNKGILYDDTVAEACLRLFREKGYQLK